MLIFSCQTLHTTHSHKHKTKSRIPSEIASTTFPLASCAAMRFSSLTLTERSPIYNNKNHNLNIQTQIALNNKKHNALNKIPFAEDHYQAQQFHLRAQNQIQLSLHLPIQPPPFHSYHFHHCLIRPALTKKEAKTTCKLNFFSLISYKKHIQITASANMVWK